MAGAGPRVVLSRLGDLVGAEVRGPGPGPASGVPADVGRSSAALAPSYGPEVERDDEGDFPVLTGVVPIWIRVLDDRPALR